MKKENGKWNNKTNISIICMLVFIVMLVTSINACGYFGLFGEASWKEEVLLHDGSKIIVKRWQKRGGGHEIGQKPDISEQSIKFTMPGTKKVIKWKDEYSKEINRSNFTLVALHILNTTPYIITTPRLCLSYNKWGRPNPPYVIFKYESNAWKRIDVAVLPMEFKNINLAVDTLNDEVKLRNQGLVSAEMIQKLNNELTQEEFKTILRTPIKIWCEEMVYDGRGGWMGIGYFNRKTTYEECFNECRRTMYDIKYCPCSRLFKTETKEK